LIARPPDGSMPTIMPKNPIVRSTAAVALLLIVAAVLLLYTPWGRALWQGGDEAGPGAALIGGPFRLTDQNGQLRTDADFRGQYLLVFFGYSNCPDVCPTTLQTLTTALDKLGADAAKVTPIFITVDPARDTPSALKDYAANFTPRLVALSGSPADIAAVAKAYRIYYKNADDGPNYSMDHTALVYLMGPDGKYLAHFGTEATADDIAKSLRQRL
jgi:cytochrome oxidase Cu insertion factor (SCO1/SenC/PrrC family)